MSWSADDFFPAFDDAGMLSEMSFQPSIGPIIVGNVGFQAPDEIMLGGVVHSSGYSIEYRLDTFPIKRSDIVAIGGAQYKVRQPPLANGDGIYGVAQLEKLP